MYQRHSNSIDVGRQACGRCQNRLVFLGRFQPDGTPARRRPPSAFSAFVRDNFANVRAGLKGTPHQEVLPGLVLAVVAFPESGTAVSIMKWAKCFRSTVVVLFLDSAWRSHAKPAPLSALIATLLCATQLD